MIAARSLQVVGVPDVEPWFMHRVNDSASRFLLQAREQRRHVAVFILADQIECVRLKDIDSRVDVTARDGLLFKANNVHALCLYHTKRVLPLVQPYRHRG